MPRGPWGAPSQSEKQEGKEVERKVRHDGSHSLRMKLSSLSLGGSKCFLLFTEGTFPGQHLLDLRPI